MHTRLPESPPAACDVRVLSRRMDLLAAFRLRQRVYGALGYTPSDTAAGLEIDRYDVYSVPFGAFVGRRLVGTLRLVTTTLQMKHAVGVQQIVGALHDDELRLRAFGPRPHLLPSIISPAVQSRIDAFNVAGYPVQELSRTIVEPSQRGSGVARALMELGIAYASRVSPVVLVGGCLAQHVPMYEKYGYIQLPDTTADRFDSVGQIAHAVVCRTDVLPQPTRHNVDEQRQRLRGNAVVDSRHAPLHLTAGRVAAEGSH